MAYGGKRYESLIFQWVSYIHLYVAKGGQKGAKGYFPQLAFFGEKLRKNYAPNIAHQRLFDVFLVYFGAREKPLFGSNDGRGCFSASILL